MHPGIKSQVRTVAAAAVFSCAGLALGQGSIADIGVLPGATTSAVYGVSRDGLTVVGGCAARPVRWTASHGLEDLGIIEDGYARQFSARAVSDDGSVVVGNTVNGLDLYYHIFRWTPETGVVDIGLPNGADASEIVQFNGMYSMSGDGSVIGATVYSFDTTISMGCRWSNRTGEDVFELIPSAQTIDCVARNGSALIGTLPDGNAMRLDDNGTSQMLGDFGPSAADDDGEIVSGTATGPLGGLPVKWSQQAGLVFLPLFPQAGNSDAGPMTADGSLIFGLIERPNVENEQCLWIGSNTPIALLDYLALANVDLTGWTQLNVRAINGDGSVFAGIGLHNGVQRGFVLRLRQNCGSADFNHDGDVGTDMDINDFFSCLSGNCCPTCPTRDFNGDGDDGTDADIEAFFRVLAGSAC